MSPELTSALVGFFAAVIGGGIQSWTSWVQDGRRYVRESRQRDYGLFLEGVAEMSQAAHGSTERAVATSKMIEAKAKILLNGSDAVVRSLEKYSRHPVLASDESFSDFCGMIKAMRINVGGIVAWDFEKDARAIIFEDRTT